ncbi:MAG: redoxin family protein, partial [Planctomycetaceae bacterium]|nr:redoxin family protein [Planctomycetaceae bacterium]
ITDSGLETLAKLTNLQVLFLPYNRFPQMTTAGISKLNALSELRVLSASSSLKEDPAAPPMNLSNLRELRQLYISPLRDDDLVSIANLPKLEWLLFGGFALTDKGLSYLSNLKTLTRLQLYQASLPTDASIEHFQGLGSLFELTLNGKFTDVGLERIGNLKSIQVLNIMSYGETFTPTAKQKLYDNLPNLKRASIEDARVKRGKKRKPQNVVRKAPDFSVKTLNGNTLTRDDFKGNVLLIYFWFTSCKPCVAATPEIKKSYENVTNEFSDFRMLSLSTHSYDALVQQHVDKHELSWPQARIGPDSKLQAEFDVEGFPHFVVIDREGNVRYNGPSGSRLDEQLRTALEEKKKK